MTNANADAENATPSVGGAAVDERKGLRKWNGSHLRSHRLIDRSPPIWKSGKRLFDGHSSVVPRNESRGQPRVCSAMYMPGCARTYQMSFSDVSSLTIRLSRGDRPVFFPENAVKAPLSVMAVPVSYTNASS